MHTASHDRIDQLHASMAGRFGELLAATCQISPFPKYQDRWANRAPEGEVDFFLWDEAGIFSHLPHRDGCPVVRLNISDDENGSETAWVSWRELWTSDESRPGHFHLCEAGFTFFWGTAFGVDTQLFRAEWVQPVKQETGEHAHPHWQIDWPVMNEADISGVHLGMVSWQHGNAPADWWQRFVCGRWIELDEWAERTLRYAQQQLARFPLA